MKNCNLRFYLEHEDPAPYSITPSTYWLWEAMSGHVCSEPKSFFGNLWSPHAVNLPTKACLKYISLRWGFFVCFKCKHLIVPVPHRQQFSQAAQQVAHLLTGPEMHVTRILWQEINFWSGFKAWGIHVLSSGTLGLEKNPRMSKF